MKESLSEERIKEIRERAANRDSTVEDVRDLLGEVERLRQPSVPIDQATCDHEFQEVCLRCGKDCAEWAWESHQKDVAGAHRIRRSE